MLLHLHIRDFAIIPSLDQEFQPGFTAISGETGAGKSIMVDALGLLLGARSDSQWVMAGADRAELNAEFSVSGNAAALVCMQEQDLDDGTNCLLRRTIAAGGRSRAWINGTPVTVQQLSELGHLLVEVHGQNEHVRLTGARRQLELLDLSGPYSTELEQLHNAFDHWQKLERQFAQQQASAALPPGEIEFMRRQLEELEESAISPKELAALEQEHRLQAGSGELMADLKTTQALLDSDGRGAVSQLHESIGHLMAHKDLDRGMDEARLMLEDALINTQEALASLQSASNRVDVSPEQLQKTHQQLSHLNSLARKHGVAMEELQQAASGLREKLTAAEQFESIRTALESDLADALASYRKCAARLSACRTRFADELASRVEKLMFELGMEGGCFEVAVEHHPDGQPTRRGDDRVSIMVSANPGMPPGPLSKVASGGELSRISLAIKVATANAAGRTQVFDEIDTGVGGDTANAVGRLLSKVAGGGQALCVTHLAQVAVRADQQLQVIKQSSEDHTRVDTRVLDEQSRVEEIARMLGGKVSEQSRAHAVEMLEAAGGSVH